MRQLHHISVYYALIKRITQLLVDGQTREKKRKPVRKEAGICGQATQEALSRPYRRSGLVYVHKAHTRLELTLGVRRFGRVALAPGTKQQPELKTAYDIRENVAHGRAKQGQKDNDHARHQDDQ